MTTSLPSLPQVAAFCALRNPYSPAQESQPMFHAAMLELTVYHLERTPGYRRWLADAGISIDVLAASRDWSLLPPIHANYFKRHLPSSSDVMPTTEFRSSGTSGQKSVMHYDTPGLHALMHMSDRIFEYYGWHTPHTPCNYLLFAYELTQGEEDSGDFSGSAKTDQFLCKYAPSARVVHALRRTGRNDGISHEFDPYGAIRSLQEFAAEGLPVRIFGFPAFLWFVLQRMRDLDLPPLTLHPDSLVMTGGGWKTHIAQEIDKYHLHQRLGEQLGIAKERCRDGYGSVEHPVPYIECAHHRFHVPTYARALVRDSYDMRVLDYGTPGLLHLMSPYLMSCPAHSMVLGDLATLLPGGDCDCGNPTDSFVLHGRAGNQKNRSCALAAAELIERGI